MRYAVSILRSAQKQLEKIPFEPQDRILGLLSSLADSPRPVGASKLVGRNGMRIRVGNYRVLYEVDDDAKNVLVVAIAHRKDVYR